MSPEFERCYDLVQMTPIVHFQPDWNGASLRATELKPKLDKFLIKYAFNDRKELYETFLVGYDPKDKEKKPEQEERKAFDYRIVIHVDETKSTKEKLVGDSRSDIVGALIVINHRTDKEYGRMTTGDGAIQLRITSMHTKLLKAIDEWLPAFFAITNFGKRQNKGFGSFWLGGKYNNHKAYVTALQKWATADKDMREDLRALQGDGLEPYLYSYELSCDDDEPWKAVLNNIKKLYYHMRGGYMKLPSYLMAEYLPDKFQGNSKGMYPEKLSIKRDLLQKIHRINDQINSLDGSAYTKANNSVYGYYSGVATTAEEPEYRYFRGMLGLADHFDYMSLKFKDKKATIQARNVVPDVNYPDNTTKWKKGKIDRFKSPITFKPVVFSNNRWFIYAIPHDIEPEMSEANFQFYMKDGDREPNSSTDPSPVIIPAPKLNVEFNLLDFLQGYFQKHKASAPDLDNRWNDL